MSYILFVGIYVQLGLTAGVVLAKDLRSLMLVLTSLLVLLMWELMLWLAEYATRTPAL